MKEIRLAIIGCGGFCRYHVKTIVEKLPQIEVVGLCDIARDHAEKMREEYFAKSDPPIFLDYRDMLNDVKPQAVHVSTPHTLHFRHAYDSLSAGAHVMVDKPMVTDSRQARQLVRKAQAKKKLLSVAVQGIHTDTFAYARKLIEDGTMGPLQLVTAYFGQNWMKGTVGLWRQDPKLSGGGQLYDSCYHVNSTMMYLVNSQVKEVFCWADYKGCKVDINAVVVIKFANGCMATVTSGGNTAGWKSHLHIQGENAMMEISPHGGDFKVYAQKWKEPITAPPPAFVKKNPKVSPIENFAQAIAGKAKLRCTGHVGILVADLMDAIYASVRSGKPVKVR
ncbi:MAG: Gfo/Idh/MocA family protein [Phycisphaerae bacterium]